MFPIVCTSSSDISFLVISSLHWSFIWKHTKYQIYQLAKVKNSTGSLGPICQTPSFCPSIMLGIQIVRAGAKRCGTLLEFTIFPLGGWGMWIIYVPDAQIFVLSTVSWVPLPLRGGGLSASFPSLLGHQSTHTACFSWWWGQGQRMNGLLRLRLRNATLGLLVLLSHPLPRQ